MNAYAALGSRIAELRTSRGMAQESFAVQVGVARSYMSRIERGKARLTLDIMLRIARELDTTASELLFGLE